MDKGEPMTQPSAEQLLRDVETFLMIVEPRSHKGEARELLDRVRAYLASAGDTTPPREPTQAMILAGIKANVALPECLPLYESELCAIWRAMADAAPNGEHPVSREWRIVKDAGLDGVSHEDGWTLMSTATAESLKARAAPSAPPTQEPRAEKQKT